MQPLLTTETIAVNTANVACDGGTEGHPRVYLHIDHETGDIVCPYCSRRYVLKAPRVGH